MKITIIGCGNMGRSFAERLSAEHTLFLYDRHEEKCLDLQKRGHGTSCYELQKGLPEALEQSDVVILAVKPQGVKEAAKLMTARCPEGQMLISLLTGTRIAALKALYPQQVVVRMMPNLAITCGEGLIGVAVEPTLTEKEKEMTVQICRPLGHIHWLEEEMMNAFTSLAGSGPAFVLALIEAIIKAGVDMGFSVQEAKTLVPQMMQGTLQLLDNSGKSPAELQQQISSPGGTTVAGLKIIKDFAIQEGLIKTFLAAYIRANELE